MNRRRRERFARLLSGWILRVATRSKLPAIRCSAIVDLNLVAFTFSMAAEPAPYTETGDGLEPLLARAHAIAPAADPWAGDLAVFDGTSFHVFRRPNEAWTAKAAVAVASEVTWAVIDHKERRGA